MKPSKASYVRAYVCTLVLATSECVCAILACMHTCAEIADERDRCTKEVRRAQNLIHLRHTLLHVMLHNTRGEVRQRYERVLQNERVDGQLG